MITTITYRATNKRNGKWYVGSTQQPLDSRIRQHITYKINDEFHNSLRKNPDHYTWEVLSETEGDDRSHEQEILDVFVGSRYCMNISRFAAGGNGWSHISDEIRSENGRKFMENFHSLSETDPKKYKQHQSKAGKGGAEEVHRETNEKGQSKHAIEMSRKGVETRRKNPEKMSDDAKRAAQKTRKPGGTRRQRVQATYVSTGDVVVFDTIRTASKLIGGPYPSMQNHINQGRIFRGYLLERVDPED